MPRIWRSRGGGNVETAEVAISRQLSVFGDQLSTGEQARRPHRCQHRAGALRSWNVSRGGLLPGIRARGLPGATRFAWQSWPASVVRSPRRHETRAPDRANPDARAHDAIHRLGASPSSQCEVGRPGHVWPWQCPTDSRRHQELPDHFWDLFAVVQSIGQNTQRKGLRFGDSFLASLPVGHRSRKVDDLGEPPPVILLFDLDGQFHSRHLDTHVSRCPQGRRTARPV